MFRNQLKTILSNKDLKDIGDAVTGAEQNTSGEIRVAIRQRRGFNERKTPLEVIAQREFHQLGMTRTEGRTGVLIFLILEDRKFRIVADQGIHAKVGEAAWQKVANEISSHFSDKKFKEGILHGVSEVGKMLATHFPPSGNNKNELSNDVWVR
ncbi:MAG: TPM domain-containing protein [Bacteroidota bacterium]